MKTDSAFYEGFKRGNEWQGPNGDSSLGALSVQFVREEAERAACGFRFNELEDGPDETEAELARRYMRGFWAAWYAKD